MEIRDIFAPLIDFVAAREASKQIVAIVETTSTKYVGQEVTYTWPLGKKENAVIVAMEFDTGTYDRRDEQWGAWIYTIRLMRDGTQTTAGSEALVFTGKYYADIGKKRPQAKIKGIGWSK